MTPDRIGTFERLWRYYQAGILNAAFGYATYALLIKVGVWIYLAQFIAHIFGVIFNYFTYSGHAFSDFEASKLRFIVAYVFNYFVGVIGLFVAVRLSDSPYIAGIVSILGASVVNYFVLKRLVFVHVARTEP